MKKNKLLLIIIKLIDMKISIVTTIYNVEKYIEKCLTSLVNQTYKDLEIILVNDCSTDSSMDIVSLVR